MRFTTQELLAKAEIALGHAESMLNFWSQKDEQAHPRGRAGSGKGGQWVKKGQGGGGGASPKASKAPQKPVSGPANGKSTSEPPKPPATPAKPPEQPKKPDQLLAALEYVPSKRQPDFDQVMNLPYDPRERLNDLMESEFGAELQRMLGIKPQNQINSPGGWEGNVNPSLKHVLPPETSQQQAQLYGAAIGYIARQDSVMLARIKSPTASAPGKFVGAAVRKEGPNGEELPLTKEEATSIYQELYKNDPNKSATVGFMQIGNKMVFLNTQGGPENGSWEKDFAAAWQGVASHHEYAYDVVSSDSEFVGNDWQEKPDGTDYTQKFLDAGRPDLQRWCVGDAGPRAQAVIAKFLAGQAPKPADGRAQLPESAGQAPAGFSAAPQTTLDRALSALSALERLAMEFRALPPRGGNPENPGQFSKKAGGYAGREAATPSKKKPTTSRIVGTLKKNGHTAKYHLQAGTTWVRFECAETLKSRFPEKISVPEGSTPGSMMDSVTHEEES